MKHRLNKLADQLVIERKNRERQEIRASLKDLEQKLKSHFKGEVLKTIPFGSWIRNSILPRKWDLHSDVDLLILFKTDEKELTPGEYRSKLKRFLEENYSENDTQRDYPAVTLELKKIRFELVPAIKESKDFSSYDIPCQSHRDKWQKTKPKDIKKKLKKANRVYNGLVSRIIRLSKYWNASSDYQLSSYLMERRIIELDFMGKDIYASFLHAMDEFALELPDVKKIIDSIRNYRSDGDSKKELEEMKKLLPEL